MMGGKSGAFRGFSSSCSPYIHTIISSHSHNNNLRNVPMPSRHTKTHACESGRMFPKWTERVNQEPHRGVGSNLAHYLCERSSRFRSCLRHLAEPAGSQYGAYAPRASALGTAPPDLGRCTLRFYGESRSKVSFVANFTAEWNHEEHCAEEPFTHALAARPVCALTLAPRATVTFVHMHSIANFPEGRPDQGHSFLQKSRPTERGYSGAVIKTRFDH